MFRFVGNQLLKINLSSTEKFDGVRKICVNSCVHLRSRAEELAEKKRRDEENNWNKLYLYNDMVSHITDISVQKRLFEMKNQTKI